MSKRIPGPIFAMLMAVSLMSCQSTGPAQNTGAENATSSPQHPSANSTLSSETPCPVQSPDANHKIVLTAPCDGDRVAQRNFVEGVLSDTNAEVAVVIHPMGASDFWVQPNVTVRDGGRWRVLCYFGEPGPQHSGKHFEVMAIVMNGKGQLQEGQLFHNWPQGQSKSQVIEVVRE
jgi:hypothetical protein